MNKKFRVQSLLTPKIDWCLNLMISNNKELLSEMNDFWNFLKKKKKKTLVLLRLDQQREQELGLVNILGHQDRKTRHGFCPPSELQTKSSRSPIPSPLPTFSSIYWWSRGFLLSKRKRYRTKLRSTKQNSKGLELKTNPVEGDWSKRP